MQLAPKLKVVERALGPAVQEIKRFLCSRGLGRFRFTITDFSRHTFSCSGQTEIFRTLGYGGEKIPLAAFLFYLKDEDVVWDVGASIGLFTVHSAAACRRVVAFEPDPATFARLDEHVTMNGLRSKVDLYSTALGSASGELVLRTDGLDGFAPSLADLGRHGEQVKVPVETIDGLISQGVPPPTVLKMDIEGAEILALTGGMGLLRSPQKPRLLFIEVHPQFLPSYGSNARAVEQLISEAGYKLLCTQQRDDRYHLIAAA